MGTSIRREVKFNATEKTVTIKIIRGFYGRPGYQIIKERTYTLTDSSCGRMLVLSRMHTEPWGLCYYLDGTKYVTVYLWNTVDRNEFSQTP